MKNQKNLASLICLLSVLVALAAFAVSFEEKNVTAFSTSERTDYNNDIYERAGLYLKDEYEGGLKTDPNRWGTVEYDLLRFRLDVFSDVGDLGM